MPEWHRRRPVVVDIQRSVALTRSRSMYPRAIRGSPPLGCDGTAPACRSSAAAQPGSCRRDAASRRPSRTVPHLASLPGPPPGAMPSLGGPQGRRACLSLPLSPLLPFCSTRQGPSSDSMDEGAPSLLAAGLRAITGFQKRHIRGTHRGIAHACNEALLEKRGSFVACQSVCYMAPRCVPATRPPAPPRPCR